jgi:1,2-diacylglycerol 3-beta-galactosyltransferase
VLILHTIAGGGHKSAALAIREALEDRYGAGVHCEMVDALKDYAPKPLDLAPEHYTMMIKAPMLYRQFYELGNGKRRSKIITNSISLYARRQADTILRNHPADVIVSTYHFTSAPLFSAMKRKGLKTPFVTVVTDLITIPPVWFDPRTNLTVLPTEPAYHQAIMAGMPRERLKLVGLPVSPRFAPVTAAKKVALRRQLGWPTDRLVAVLMAGGAGIGPLGAMGRSVVASGLPITPVIVTGNNRRLATRLRREPWATDAFIYDFVDDIPSFMQAADVLVTKAGPGTITEALNTNLPIILYSRVPGQEEGNTEYVTHSGAGFWAPKRTQLVATLQYLLDEPDALKQASVAGSRLAKTGAADTIAQLVVETAHKDLAAAK